MPAVKGIVDYFNYNEQEKRLIETLRIQKGEYSEVFFSQSIQLQNLSAKMVICPTPIEYWVATTDAMDLNYYEKIKRRILIWICMPFYKNAPKISRAGSAIRTVRAFN